MLCMSVLKMVIFVRIVQLGSLSKAATSLTMSPPAVSRHLKDLERVLQVSLMRRSTRALALTQAGEKTYVYFNTFLEGLDGFCEDLLQHASHPYKKPKQHSSLRLENSQYSVSL